jgi:SAM-dependent methyltransferase
MSNTQGSTSLASNIPLNELPKWSVWPARLLGLEPWSVPVRTPDKVDKEYDKDKYASCLRFCQERAHEIVTPEDVKKFEIGGDFENTLCVSQGDNLVAMSTEDVISYQSSLLIETMRSAIEEASVVVELGCGYGSNLWMLQRLFPAKLFVGGDYSANAVQLARILFKTYSRIVIQQFNFYDKQYNLLQHYDHSGPMVIFTSHAIEQLPSALSVLDALGCCRKHVYKVFHFEPVYELYDASLLGMLCRRYTEVNDYNRDLLSALQRCSDIRILQVKANVFGWNPLNPTSIIQWEFAC